jgi:hypothetical protein
MTARWGIALIAIAGTVHAQPAADRFAEGRALLAQGRAAEACGKFEAALKLEPDAAGVLLNLGLCNAQQRKLASALRWFRKAEASGDPDVEAAAKQQVTTLSSLVPRIRIDAPVGAAVTIDGAAVDPAHVLEIDAGHHVATLDGGPPQPFDVHESANADVIVLRRPEPPPPSHRTAWIVGGLGAGLVVGSAVVGLVGKSQFDGSHDLDTRKHWKSIVLYGGTTMFAAGCIALGTATVLYVRGRRAEHTVVAPVVTPEQAGVAITGVF